MSQNTFFTSDNHFGHKNIFKFCRETRHGRDVDEMNEHMIEKWNAMVTDNDRVYCLGDFSFMRSDKTEDVLKRLKGQIHLILGNHDQWLNAATSAYFESVSHYKKITLDGVKVIMFHYPIFEWENIHYGSFHLFGHVHGSVTVPGRAMDVGIDARPQKDMGLWEWEEVRKILSQREIRAHHGAVASGAM